jgi:hypothetical protein
VVKYVESNLGDAEVMVDEVGRELKPVVDLGNNHRSRIR